MSKYEENERPDGEIGKRCGLRSRWSTILESSSLSSGTPMDVGEFLEQDKKPGWRNWQTHYFEGVAFERTWQFESAPGHK